MRFCNQAEVDYWRRLTQLMGMPKRGPRGDPRNMDRAQIAREAGQVWNGLVHEFVHPHAARRERGEKDRGSQKVTS